MFSFEFWLSDNLRNEWAGYMLVGIGFLGLAYTQKRGKHIQIEMVTSRLPESVRKKMEIVVLIVGVLFIGWLAASTMEPVLQSYRIHRMSLNVIQTPMWIPSLMVPAGLGMLCIELVIELMEQLWEARRIMKGEMGQSMGRTLTQSASIFSAGIVGRFQGHRDDKMR
jgi:TRAP-type C4-dicarboxylate transport system permease small subunit